MNIYVRMVFLWFAFLGGGAALAQNSASIDNCADSSVNYKDVPNLTRQEKIDLMDKALLGSLNKYERCQNSRDQASATSAADAVSNAGGRSTASSEMSGTTAVAESKSNSQVNEKVDEEKGQKKQSRGKRVLGSGKIPDDIPPADNDSVLEEQIRQAAINETDPVIKEKLWNEYRKYKGLPVTAKH